MPGGKSFWKGFVCGAVLGILCFIIVGFTVVRIAENRLLERNKVRIKAFEAQERQALRRPEFSRRSSLGQASFEWTLTTLGGDPIPFSRFRGKVTLLSFWATWCVPCLAEMPSLEELQKSLPRDELALILVTQEDPKTVRAFLKERPLHLPIYRVERELPEVFRSEALPYAFLVGPNGEILLKQVGAARWDDELFIEQLKIIARKS